MSGSSILVLGGTGRTGSRVIQQLLARGVRVRAIVRSASRLPESVAEDPNLTVVEADLLAMSDENLRRQMDGCVAIVSCLGHNLNARGMFGRPRDLVTRSVQRVCHVTGELKPVRPIRLVLMSSVSVHRPGKLDARRGGAERAMLAILRALLPPAKDNQDAADFLMSEVGTANPCVEWVAVRPDTLIEGDVSGYALHDGLISSLSKPDRTAMANVAHFMCELTCDAQAWERWKGTLPVIVNVESE